MWWEAAGELGVLEAGELLWEEVPEERRRQINHSLSLFILLL